MGPDWLKRHPFAVEAWFDRSLVLTYALPAAELRGLLPAPLELDTHGEEQGFVAVAAVDTRAMRPRGWPSWLGRGFLLVGYRLFARYRSASGRRLRGLYILRSETDRKSMELAGNLFTRYRYATTEVAMRQLDGRIELRDGGGLAVVAEPGGDGPVPLPAGSPFTGWREARRWAGPLPFTFSVEPAGDRVVIIEGVRESWEPRPARVHEHRVPFVDSLGGSPVLASAFTVEGIPYRWKRGEIERWRS